jgi:hypothetical protein
LTRTCVFCGAAPTTGEHVWPDWLRRKLAVEEILPHTQLFEHHGEVVDEISYEARPYRIRANAVCASCNNGWMSGLEESAKAILEGMIDGRARLLHSGGQTTLASWALLKAMMFDRAVPAESRAIFPGLYAHLFEHRVPPRDGVRVWLAAGGAEADPFSAFAALEASAPGEARPAERNVFVRTFSVGRVLVQVFGTTSPALEQIEVDWSAFGPPPSPAVLEIWPAGSARTWWPEPALSVEGAQGWFANQLVAALMQHADRHRP